MTETHRALSLPAIATLAAAREKGTFVADVACGPCSAAGPSAHSEGAAHRRDRPNRHHCCFPPRGARRRLLRRVSSPLVGPRTPSAGPPRRALRPQLVTSNGVTHDSTIYVAGPDGELYGFASPRQFLGGGFDPALVVTVPGLDNLPVSASTAGATHITALSTQADGAIIFSGQTYVFAAGTAFVLPGDLAQRRTTDDAAVLTGTVGQTETRAPLASGVLLSVDRQGVYVTYQGQLFPFSSMAQLAAEGYGGTAAVPVPASVVASVPQA
jgi:hypothetical protein